MVQKNLKEKMKHNKTRCLVEMIGRMCVFTITSRTETHHLPTRSELYSTLPSEQVSTPQSSRPSLIQAHCIPKNITICQATGFFAFFIVKHTKHVVNSSFIMFTLENKRSQSIGKPCVNIQAPTQKHFTKSETR